MRSLVSGAAGFVGANLIRHLLAGGDDVVACIRPGGRGWRLADIAGDVEISEVDLLDDAAVHDAVAAGRPDRVFHLAAEGAYSWVTDCDRILSANIQGTQALLSATRAAECDVFVHAGSSSEYGLKRAAPSEAEVLEPNSTYAVGKAAATHLTSLAHAQGLHATTLRLYSVYGPWEDPRRLMANLVRHALRGELPPLANPSTARDFVHVEDVCDAFVRAAEAKLVAPVYNIASGVQVSLEEVVSTVRGLVGALPEPRWGDCGDRAWDTDVWVGDASRIRDELGWSTRFDLPAGLAQTLEWFATDVSAAAYVAADRAVGAT